MNKKTMITAIALILIIVLLGVLGYGYYRKATFSVNNPIATMEVENFGTIKVELYPDQAPNSVANFIALANNGYYDGMTFYRVVKDFVIQGGSTEKTPKLNNIDSSIAEDSSENKEYSIPGEFLANGYNNTLKLEEGVLAMARADYTSYSTSLYKESYNSATSDFFIMTSNTHSNISGNYAGFGKVTEGLDIVHEIEKVEIAEAKEENSEASTPVNPPVITSIRVETYGIDYGMPETQEPFNYMKWLYSLYGMQYTE